MQFMVGKTPEYLNMPIGAREMKCIVLVFLIHPILILVFSALAFMIPGASESITNPSFHGICKLCMNDISCCEQWIRV